MGLMEELISRNMEELCNFTDPNETLLDVLLQKKIISNEKRNKILKKNGDYSKNFELFTFLQNSRTDKDIDNVILALDRLDQSSNARILEIFQTLKNPGAIIIKSEKTEVEGGRVSKSVAAQQQLPPSSSLAQNLNMVDELDAHMYTGVQTYPNTGRKMALVINVLAKRRGAEHDTTALEGTLFRCGFEIVKCRNFTERGILSMIDTFKKDLDGVTCCIVAVMSHGIGVYDFLTEDGHDLNFKKVVVNEFNNVKCPTLRNMPKIFLANFCRGDKVDTCTDSRNIQEANNARIETDSSFEETDSTGSFSDMMECHGTYDDHYAYRTERGTWFIQGLCQVLQTRANGKTDFKEIMDLVFDKVNEEETEYGAKQCPTYGVTGFSKKLYLKYDPAIEIRMTD